VTGDFLEAYEEHVRHIYGFLAYRLDTRADAEDLTQQTFERALRGWERFDSSRASARTWLLTIARNLLIDHYRRDRSGQQEQIDEAEAHGRLGAVAPPEEWLGVEPELGAALGSLSERERELIALRFGGDLTGPEIAELTGLSLANVQQILSRSLRRLRAELEARDSRAT
jgi:RNA polymerase sigma factor (sigma-70 family)